MRDIGKGETRPYEHSVSASEASLTGTSVQSPNSEDIESEVFDSSPQVIDPLRYPKQDVHLKSISPRWSSKSVGEPDSRAPNVSMDSKHLSMSALEQSLPRAEAYEPETVDFPSSPTLLAPVQRPRGVSLDAVDPEGPATYGLVLDAMVQSCSVEKVPTRKVDRPSTLEINQKKRLTVTEELLTVSVEEDQQSVTSLSCQNTDEDDDDAEMTSHEEFTDMLTPDDIHTPDVLEESIMMRLGPKDEQIPMGVDDGSEDPESSWRSVVISGIQRRIDMTVIEPYKKVLSHGGYMPGGGAEAIIVFSACFLPDRSRKDYDYVMDHLFMYVLTTLDQLVADDYILVYLHGGTTRSNMPSFSWIKRCYQLIDRRLRKNLQGLYLVHPSFWVKTVVMMVRPFISSKFTRKLRFIESLKELQITIPLDQSSIPSRVKQYDSIRESLLQDKQR